MIKCEKNNLTINLINKKKIKIFVIQILFATIIKNKRIQALLLIPEKNEKKSKLNYCKSKIFFFFLFYSFVSVCVIEKLSEVREKKKYIYVITSKNIPTKRINISSIRINTVSNVLC